MRHDDFFKMNVVEPEIPHLFAGPFDGLRGPGRSAEARSNPFAQFFQNLISAARLQRCTDDHLRFILVGAFPEGISCLAGEGLMNDEWKKEERYPLHR